MFFKKFFTWRAKMPRSTKPLLVIDLNGVLVDRRQKKLKERQSLGKWGFRHAYGRPHAADFVAWATAMGWSVAVWTSARRENAEPLARAALGQAYACLSFVYTQDECEAAGKPAGAAKPLFRKPLARLWREGLGAPQRTVLLDDGKEKICEGEEDNALICPQYDALRERDDALAPGGWVRTALAEIMAEADVRDAIVRTY
jgi:hypothetical protein